MNLDEKYLLAAIDGIWGACDALKEICEDLIDTDDARLHRCRCALDKAQTAASRLMGLE